MTADAGFDLYLIVDGSSAQVERAVSLVRILHTPRLALQLRMKAAPPAQLAEVAGTLRQATREAGSPLFVNASTEGAVDVALQANADGLQLPRKRPPRSRWRPRLLAGQRVGISVHDAAEIARAEADAADFVLLSPLGDVPDKGRALGPERFAQLARAASVPVVALGGIGPENAAQARHAGACAVAAIRSVLGADDPICAARSILQTLADRHTHGM